MIRRSLNTILILLCFSVQACAADANELFNTLRRKIFTVQDYTADVKMKISVKYMRIPQLAGTLYFKSPDKMRLERHGGLSILPRKNINLTIRNLIPAGSATVIDAGEAQIGGKKTRIITVIPEDDKSDLVLSKIWVDETSMVALRIETATRNEGTITMDLEYGQYISYGLPDKLLLTLDVKDFRMPKGMTMDYTESRPDEALKDAKGKKGTIQITYLSYKINTGLSDKNFTPEASEQ